MEPADPGIRVYRVGSEVSPPAVLNNVEAHYSDAARKANISGICLISMVVGRDGLPRNVIVIRSLEPDLDENVLKAVKMYRFKPAMKGNQPVSVLITVEVNFKLY